MVEKDRNDEMEMKESDARLLLIRTDDVDDGENRLVNSRSTAMAMVPHSLSFYAIFYKMTMKTCECRRRIKTNESYIGNINVWKAKKKVERYVCLSVFKLVKSLATTRWHQHTRLTDKPTKDKINIECH